jgi:hypothetical protein
VYKSVREISVLNLKLIVMKELNFEPMAMINGGSELMPCDQAIIIGVIMGGWFGGFGAIIGGIGVAVGPNCLGWLDFR